METEIEKQVALMEKSGVVTAINTNAAYNPKRVYHPTEGNAWNPLRAWPRNERCFCGSNIKFKKCHMGKVPECVSEREAEENKKAIEALKKGMTVKLVPKAPDTNVGKILDGG